jgi:hypothetical protein
MKLPVTDRKSGVHACKAKAGGMHAIFRAE